MNFPASGPALLEKANFLPTASDWQLLSAARAPQRFIKRICGRHRDIGGDSGVLPIRLGDRVHNAGERHPDEEVTIDAVGCHRMGTATCRLTNQSCSFEAFQVEAEFFC
jgi:hypothetical protein